jgi:hypothetical protein
MNRSSQAVLTSLGIAIAASLCAPAARAQDADACIAANESSVSLRKAGKLIDGRKALATCAAPSCPDPIRSSCQARIGEIDHAVPSVVFVVKDAAGNDVPNVRISVDGQPRQERMGAAMALDPGQHTFTFEGDGLPPVSKVLVIVEGVKDRSETVTLGAPATPAATTPPPADTTGPAAASSGGGSTQKTIGLVVGGVGIAGLAVGSVFGLLASSKWNAAQSDHSSDEEQSANGLATVSTVGFIAGGVCVAAGAVLWFTAPSGGGATSQSAWAIAPSASPGGGGLLLRGGF